MRRIVDRTGVESFHCETTAELFRYWLECRDHPYEIVCPASVVQYWRRIEQRVGALAPETPE